MGEWKKYKLEDIAIIIDCEHKTAPIVTNSDFYSVRTANISQGKIDYQSCNRVSKETYLAWTNRAIPVYGDIIFAREAPVGEVGFVEKKFKVCLGQRTVLIRINSNNVDNRFLLYYLVNPTNKKELIEKSTGSVVSHVNVKDIREHIVSLPPLPEQKSIASILSSLDDKIDLLHRQNATLEKIAETLFRQWFVEEAKEDWETVKIGDIAKNIQYGFTQSANFETVGPKFLRITDIQGGNVNWKSVPFCLANKSEFLKYQLKTGDIVVARTGASTGENLYIYKPDNVVFASYLVRIQFSELSTARYVAQHMRSSNYFDYIEGILSGSAQPNANANELTSYELALPSKDKLESFYKIVTNWDEKKHINQTQIRTLTTLRDTLLPKLMSGEVRVEM